MMNIPETNSNDILIPSDVQHAIGVDGINVKVLPAGTSPNVVYRIGDGTVHPEGWDNVDGNKYLDFYISTGATGATGEKGEDGVDAYTQAVSAGYTGTREEFWTMVQELVNGLPLTNIVLETIQFNGGTGTQGTMSWNSDEETVDLIQNGATLQLGQEVQVHCRNNTGTTISDGVIVMATGTLGASGRITVAPYDNTSSTKYIIGMTTESIPDGEDGKVTTFGKVRGIDTSVWNAGDVLYTDADGGLTNIEPTEGIINPIAFVINEHHINGTVMVRVTPANESTGGQYLGNSVTKGIEYFAQSSITSDTDMTIVAGTNGLSVESYTLADGASLTIEDGATYKII